MSIGERPLDKQMDIFNIEMDIPSMFVLVSNNCKTAIFKIENI